VAVTEVRRAAVARAAEAIIAARVFCGDERAAAVQTLVEAGVAPTPQTVCRAQAEARRLWKGHRHSASVTKPAVGPARRKASRDLS